MKLQICGRHEIGEFADQAFTHMISIVDSGDDSADLRLESVKSSNHLILYFADITEPDQIHSPNPLELSRLFVWLAKVGKIEGLLVHCTAGISRSPAVALLSLAALHPAEPMDEHMRKVAASAVLSYIWPNELVISLGDRLLHRDGAIMAAVDNWKDNQGNVSQDW